MDILCNRRAKHEIGHHLFGGYSNDFVGESKKPSHQLLSRVRAYLDEDGYGELTFDSGEGA